MNPLTSAPVTAGAENKTVKTTPSKEASDNPAPDVAGRKRSYSVFAGVAAILAGVYLAQTGAGDRKVYCAQPQFDEASRRLCGQARQEERQGGKLIRAGLSEIEGATGEMKASAISRNAFFRSNGIHYNDAASRASLTSLRLSTGGFGGTGWGHSFGG